MEKIWRDRGEYSEARRSRFHRRFAVGVVSVTATERWGHVELRGGSFFRGLICAMGCQFKDGPEDWEVWRNMSKHVREVVQDYGLEDYTVAIRIRDVLRKRLGKAQYSLGDLISYLCLVNLVSEDGDQ